MLVILDSSVHDFDRSLRESLEIHRLDDDDLESIRSHHWDYWHFFGSEIQDPELAAAFDGADFESLAHASFIRNLPPDYTPSAVITPDGQWHDLQDCGWRLIDERCASNDAATRAWTQRVGELKKDYPDWIGVQVLYHC